MITHKELSIKTADWLCRRNICRWAIAEPNIPNFEMPDVYGVKYKTSIICEIKVSRADFLADAKKRVRRYEASGMAMCLGSLRYFVTNDHLAKAEEVRDGWGLVEYRKGRFYTIKKPIPFEINLDYEFPYLSDLMAKVATLADKSLVNMGGDRVFSNYNKKGFTTKEVKNV